MRKPAAPARVARGPSGGESWFGAFTGDARRGASATAEDSRFAAAWQIEGDQAAREGRADGTATTFERLWRAFVGARALLGVALLATVVGAVAIGILPLGGVFAVSAAYAACAAGLWLAPRLGGRRGRAGRTAAPSKLDGDLWLATIGIDLLSFAALYLVAPTSGFNHTALLVLPVLMAGVLTSRLLALATAAAATLVLFAAAGLGVAAGGDLGLLAQAGLAGLGLFVVTVLAGELALRLAREERSARGSLEMARQQAQLNRLVIEEMADGVRVVDRNGRVRAANPAAQRLLVAEGEGRAAPFQLRGVPAWGALVGAVEKAFAEGDWPEAGRDVVLPFAPDVQRTLRVRVRFTRRREPGSEEFSVLFLEDLRAVQERSRQEKLAAMGRVSAGIAHEIRNPLAAIAQANALLAEDATDPAQRQLTRLVGANVERLKRIVDDVMEVAPGRPETPAALDAVAQVAGVCAEWSGAGSANRRGLLTLALPDAPVGVLFDAEHLRRVLVNLLDNAERHASGGRGSVRVELAREANEDGRVALSVLSDGPPIAGDVEPYLFEPFFSTRSRGTGLGLYICRELCERYGARIDYRTRPGEPRPNEFTVELRRGPVPAATDRVPLAS
jgi:two-component system sensor histidine kinase PilS (NtrC family)